MFTVGEEDLVIRPTLLTLTDKNAEFDLKSMYNNLLHQNMGLNRIFQMWENSIKNNQEGISNKV